MHAPGDRVFIYDNCIDRDKWLVYKIPKGWGFLLNKGRCQDVIMANCSYCCLVLDIDDDTLGLCQNRSFHSGFCATFRMYAV